MEDRRSVLKSRRLVWIALLALVAALAVVAAGCGGDDVESSGSTDTEATGGSGECDKSIWVLLPDTSSSLRFTPCLSRSSTATRMSASEKSSSMIRSASVESASWSWR